MIFNIGRTEKEHFNIFHEKKNSPKAETASVSHTIPMA